MKKNTSLIKKKKSVLHYVIQKKQQKLRSKKMLKIHFERPLKTHSEFYTMEVIWERDKIVGVMLNSFGTRNIHFTTITKGSKEIKIQFP